MSNLHNEMCLEHLHEEIIEQDIKSIKPKKRTVKDEIIDVEVDLDSK